MKKLMIMALAAMLVLAGCQQRPTSNAAPSTESSPSETTMPEITAPSATTSDKPTAPSSEPTEPSTEPPTEPSTEPPTEPTSRFDPDACQSLFGRWVLPITLDGNLLMLTEFETVVTFDLIWSFDETGCFTVTFDETAFDTALTDYESAMNTHLMEKRLQIFIADCRREGIKKKAATEKWVNEGYQEQNQAQVDAFILELNLRGRYQQLLRFGEYYIKDGVLILEYSDGTANTVDHLLDEQSLTLSGLDNEAIYLELKIRPPLRLTPEAEELS